MMKADVQIIRASFNQRRKTLANGLNNFGGMGLTKEQIQQSIEALGVPVNVRGEALSLAQFAQLSNIIGAANRKDMNKSMQTGHTIIRTIQMMEVMSYEKQQIAAAACLVAGAIGFAAVYSTQKPGKDEIPTEISQTSSIVEPTEKRHHRNYRKVDSETKWDRKNQLQGSRKISSPRKNNCILSLKM